MSRLKPAIQFEVTARDGEARTGVITTRRGQIETPVFMPVGTAGTVKGIRFEELEAPLIRWFRKAWAQAGGARFRLPATLRIHDDIKEYVLSKGSPVSSRRAR